MTTMNHYHEGPTPDVGEVFAWLGTHLTIVHVNRKKTVANVAVRQFHGATWTKRQPLPLPSDVRPCQNPTDVNCECARVPDTDVPADTQVTTITRPEVPIIASEPIIWPDVPGDDSL